MLLTWWASAEGTFTAEAQQFFDRLATEPTKARKQAYNTLIASLVSGGVWAKLDALYMFAAQDEATAVVNLVQSSFGATATSSPGFAVNRGFYGAASGLIDSNFNPSTAGGHFAQNDATHFARGLYEAVDASPLLHDAQGTPVNLITPRFTDGRYYARLNETTASVNAAIASGAHLYSTSRSAAGEFDIYIDGVFAANSATTSAAPANADLRFLANASTSYPGICAYGGFGSALSAGEHAALYAACEAYLVAVSPITWLSQSIYAGRLDSLVDLGSGVVLTGARTGATPGEVFKSTNYGETWVSKGDQTTGNAITAFAFGGGFTYMLCADSNLFRSDDLGETWSNLGTVSGNAAKPGFLLSYGIVITDDDTVLVADSAGHVFRSVNDGDDFTDIGVVSADGIYRFVLVGDGILANGWAGKVFHSSTDGASWTDQGTIAASPLYAIDYINGAALMGDDDGHVYRSTNDGTTWTDLGAIAGTAGTDDFGFASNGVGLLSTYDGNKFNYLSTDSGLTWLSVGPLPYNPTDTVEHMISVTNGSGALYLVGVTNLGYVVRVLVG
jgi:photosystem II stability/assembly factor-like uncharacterized protein